jgi:hypothetical protein
VSNRDVLLEHATGVEDLSTRGRDIVGLERSLLLLVPWTEGFFSDTEVRGLITGLQIPRFNLVLDQSIDLLESGFGDLHLWLAIDSLFHSLSRIFGDWVWRLASVGSRGVSHSGIYGIVFSIALLERGPGTLIL